MSHNTMVSNVKITDLSALDAAVRELQAEGRKVNFNAQRKTFRTWPGQPNNCDAVIELPNERFDIGLMQQADGSYAPVFDHMLDNNRVVACEFTPGEGHRTDRHTIGYLMQRYAVCLAENTAAREGHMVSREFDKTTGEIRLVCEV